MISGQVNAIYEAIIQVNVRDVRRKPVTFDAALDTGFSGFLTLPQALVEHLQLPFDRAETFTLGDGNDVDLDLYRAVVSWDGTDRYIFVISTIGNPLIGMSMLRGYEIRIDVVDGGAVRIEARR